MYPADVDPQSGCRLPLPKREELGPDAQRVYDSIADPGGATLRGLRGPGGIMLHSPELARHAQYRRDAALLDEADRIVIELGREIFTARKVAPETFARALRQFGRRKLVDLVALMGNYAGTAALLTAFDMQLDPGQPPLLPVDGPPGDKP